MLGWAGSYAIATDGRASHRRGVARVLGAALQTIAAFLSSQDAAGPYVASRPLQFAGLDLSAPRPGELLLRIDAAGVCHSDPSVVNGDRVRPLPMALGHEAAATVIETGSEHSKFAPGDRVVLAFFPACGRCKRCASGEGYLCPVAAAANGAGNTGIAPVFRSRRDADLTTAIYGRLPILVDHRVRPPRMPWPVKYSTMFHMTNDSHLFAPAPS